MGKHRIALKDVVDTRRYLSGLINRLETGDIDQKLAGKIGYIGNILLKAIELESIEKRLNRLEQAAQDRRAVDVTPEPQKLTEGNNGD